MIHRRHPQRGDIELWLLLILTGITPYVFKRLIYPVMIADTKSIQTFAAAFGPPQRTQSSTSMWRYGRYEKVAPRIDYGTSSSNDSWPQSICLPLGQLADKHHLLPNDSNNEDLATLFHNHCD